MPVVKKPGSYGGVCPITGKSGEHDHVSYTDVCDAHRRIQAAGAHRTPVLASSQIDALASTPSHALRLHFKCENFQKVGAFKYRGASNALLRLTDAEAQAGVVTHSSGTFHHSSRPVWAPIPTRYILSAT